MNIMKEKMLRRVIIVLAGFFSISMGAMISDDKLPPLVIEEDVLALLGPEQTLKKSEIEGMMEKLFPYKCPDCPKRCRNKASLTLHRKTHEKMQNNPKCLKRCRNSDLPSNKQLKC
jgi:hypothetical protein